MCLHPKIILAGDGLPAPALALRRGLHRKEEQREEAEREKKCDCQRVRTQFAPPKGTRTPAQGRGKPAVIRKHAVMAKDYGPVRVSAELGLASEAPAACAKIGHGRLQAHYCSRDTAV